MRGKTITLKVDGTRVEHAHSDMPALEFFQAAVGGCIQEVPHFTTFEGERCTAFVDEEGKLKGNRYNSQANTAWAQALGYFNPDDYLVGDVVVVMGDDAFMRAL